MAFDSGEQLPLQLGADAPVSVQEKPGGVPVPPQEALDQEASAVVRVPELDRWQQPGQHVSPQEALAVQAVSIVDTEALEIVSEVSGSLRIPLMRSERSNNPDASSSLPLPAYANPGDAGLDLHSAADKEIAPGGKAFVPTGVRLAIPPGYAGFVLPRSGLAHRNGITCLNSPGLIDSGYRGEIAVLLFNTDQRESFHVKRGDRIAQIVFLSVPAVQLVEVDELPESVRGNGGFGSSGR